MRYRVLGPLRIADAGNEAGPPGDRQRRLLAALVLERGAVVTSDRLVDLLWPDRLPADQSAALQTHVFRLRRILPEGAIETAGAGYRLNAEPDDVDAHRFGRVVAEAMSIRSDDPHRAVTMLDEALSWWRGEPYDELADLDDARIEASRLRELETLAREERLVARMQIGTDRDVLADLIAFSAQHPLRERPAELLMRALAAQGRTAEASRAFDDFRRRLAEELGIEPSPELRTLHAEVLSGEVRDSPRDTAVARPSAEPKAGSASVPTPPSSFIGRRELVGRVVERLHEQRLVTLIGPGGVGKTRVALEVGRRVESTGTRVWLCELATASVDTVEVVVAEALGVEERAGTSLRRRITEVLGPDHGLLMLDNCEHVLDAAAGLAEAVLRQCADVRVLVTSRERLAVEGEHLSPVSPFTVAEVASTADPALELFADRARAVRPDFVLDERNVALAAEICRRLDGLPLAIELAAARLQAMELPEVSAGLDHRFRLLTSGMRTAPRQRSLSAAVAWSYDLLDDEMKRAFDALGVFSGPFSAAAGISVAGLEDESMLVALVERSLVQRTGDGRYVLLETLKDFALERLTEAGHVDELRKRHAARHVDMVIETAARIPTDSAAALAEIDALLVELRAAHRCLVDTGDADADLRMVDALYDYGFMRMKPEVLGWGEEAASLGRAIDHPLTPNALASAGFGAWKRGDLVTMRRFADDSLAFTEQHGLALGIATASLVGDFAMSTGRLDEAQEWLSQSVAAHDAHSKPILRLMSATDRVLAASYADSPETSQLAEDLLTSIPEGPTPHGAYAFYGAGEAVMREDPLEARRRAQRALDEAEVTGAWFVTGIAGTLAASIDARHGEVEAAVAAYRWLLPWWRRAGEYSVLWTLLRSIAQLLHRLGRPRPAAVLLGAVTATRVGHEVFGDDAVRLADLAAQLEAELGSDFAVARAEGASLDVEAAAALAATEIEG